VKLVDLNILLYAINRDTAHHKAVLRWWEQALNGDESVGLCWIVIAGFLRLSTHRVVFPKPLAVDDALARIDTWLAVDNVRLVGEKDDHWDVLRLLLSEAGTAGNLTTDAHLAALAITHGAVLVSCDNDFARFKGLRLLNPVRRA
jgi:toxin-antitoxin system PIN domain toxin